MEVEEVPAKQRQLVHYSNSSLLLLTRFFWNNVLDAPPTMVYGCCKLFLVCAAIISKLRNAKIGRKAFWFFVAIESLLKNDWERNCCAIRWRKQTKEALATKTCSVAILNRGEKLRAWFLLLTPAAPLISRLLELVYWIWRRSPRWSRPTATSSANDSKTVGSC